jgi:hypothetical protein
VLQRLDTGDHVGQLVDITESKVECDGVPMTFSAVQDMTPGHEA